LSKWQEFKVVGKILKTLNPASKPINLSIRNEFKIFAKAFQIAVNLAARKQKVSKYEQSNPIGKKV
jgi:hypothetical protein